MRGLLLILVSLSLSGQTPSFDVASLRLSDTPGPGGRTICGVNLSSDSAVSASESVLASGDRPLFAVIHDAYQDLVDTFDLPQWVFDAGHVAISVKIPPNTNAGTCRAMLRNLLEERFHLVTALVPHEVDRFFVTVAKSGLKLKPAAPVTDPYRNQSSELRGGNVIYTWRGAPMARILDIVGIQAVNDARARGVGSIFLIVRIVDETGLTGNYDGSFESPIQPNLTDVLAESLGEALTRQLGLTLEMRRGSGKVLTIRSGDRVPVEN